MYPYFTATVAVSYEPLIEKTINVFLEQLDSRFSGKKGPEGIIKLEDWLLYFTFDVIGELTYGSRHGFLESGYDSQGIIASSQGFAVYGSVVRSFPSALYEISRSHDNTRWALHLFGIDSFDIILSYCGSSERATIQGVQCPLHLSLKNV